MSKLLIIKAVVAMMLCPVWVCGQSLPGNIMVVGGGSEDAGGWSDTPYRWVTQMAQNGKVACITTDEAPTQWLPQYFMSLGASWSRNFVIRNSQTANAQETYDSLITYDALFFKGGDQWDYYHIYKGTVVEQASMEIFNRGGVVSGTSAGLQILGEVDFIAMNGTVYPEEALEDPFNNYMTLTNDFLPFFPATIFDSHVAERGRFGRITGFLGNWSLAEQQEILGIGVDDKTALCIDTSGTGYVYGTGAVGLYHAGVGNTFSISGSKLLASNLEVSQALNSCIIDFSTLNINGLQGSTQPAFYGESLSCNLMLSASDALSDNEEFLLRLKSLVPGNEEIIIITGYSLSTAQAVQNHLTQIGAASAILSTTPDNYDDPLWLQRLQSNDVYLFVDNEYEVLNDFLEYGSNGQYLKAAMAEAGKTFAFMGSDSRFAGKYCAVNYKEAYASYDGELDIREGLGLLKNSAIMPNTFNEDLNVENTATGLPYILVKENLAYGFWMHGNAWMEISASNGQISFKARGSCPVIFLENPGSPAGFADLPVSSGGLPRNIAGFTGFRMQLFDETNDIMLEDVTGIHEEGNVLGFRVFPVPTADDISIAPDVIWVKPSPSALFRVSLSGIGGDVICEKTTTLPTTLHIGHFPSGTFILSIENTKTGTHYHKKIVIIH
ncbi:MAG: cyanophycinase [Bacteroidetes bacterium]|nr:cyanophycinase [Bacteroidota bacterium]